MSRVVFGSFSDPLPREQIKVSIPTNKGFHRASSVTVSAHRCVRSGQCAKFWRGRLFRARIRCRLSGVFAGVAERRLGWGLEEQDLARAGNAN